jgi:WD40 repeat protein
LADFKYRAFVSFSHESDEQLAVALQSALSRFAKPWYRLHAMQVFQDEASLSANPALRASLEQALAQSEYLLLLASPASAQSVWVQQEVQWWLSNRSVEKIILCLTEGTIFWDNQGAGFDWTKTTALPASLKSAFSAEPLYADFRAAKASGKLRDSDPEFRAALLDVAAPLLGRPKDELDSEDIRLHRRAAQTAVAALALIIGLGVIAALAIDAAHQRQKVAASRALASEAASPLDDRSLGLLLSIESRRIADTVESRRSLLAAIQRVPHAQAFLWGHGDAITSAAFSPDGKTILSAGWDNQVILWNAATYQQIGPALKTSKDLVGVAFSPDGKQFAASAGGAVTMWDAASRAALGEPFKADEDFLHVAFSSTGKLLAANTAPYGAHPARVYVWDVATGKPFGDAILGSAFAFSPDDSLLAVADHENLQLYELRSHKAIGRPLTGHSKDITAIAFSPDAEVVAAGAEDNSIVLWGVKDQQVLGTLKGPDPVTSLLFDPHSEFLYSGSRDGTIIRWDIDNMESADTPITSFGGSIYSIFSSADGPLKALALDKEKVIILDINDNAALGRRISAPESGKSNIAFSPDGRLLASGGDFSSVALWDVAGGEPSGMPLSGHERQVTSVAFAADGKQLMSGSIDGSIIFWNVDSRALIGQPVKLKGSPVWSLASSPDGRTLASGGDGQIVLWDIATRQQRGPASVSQKDRIWSLAFSPDGALLASSGNNLQTAIRKTDLPDTLFKTFGNPAAKDDAELMPTGVSFNSAGSVLATSSRGHSLSLWNLKTGQLLPPVLTGHSQAVSSIAFSGDGQTLASGSADGTIRLWDVPTHELIGTLDARQKSVNSIAIEPRKEILASVGEDNTIVFWNIGVNDWISRACRIANRNLSPKEWSTYIGASAYRKTCADGRDQADGTALR